MWIAGKELEKNLLAGFRAEFASQGDSPVVLRITASTLYRAYLNGNFLGHGPARGPHGFFRIDELDLRKLLRPGSNLLAIEVAGYNVNSYYFPQHPSFLQAEVVQQGKVLVSTGSGNGFRSAVLPCRVQKVQRYSFQRTFSEVYRLEPGWDRWRSDAGQSFGGADLAVQPAKKYLPRGVAYPRFETRSPVRLVSSGVVEQAPLPAKPWRDRALTDIGPTLGGFAEQELEFVPSMDLQKLKSKQSAGTGRPMDVREVLRLPAQSYAIVDFGVNLTGFPGATVRCRQDIRLYLTFDEILTSGDVDFKRLNCVNAIVFDLVPGEYRVESLEPYTMRYAKWIALGAGCEIRDEFLRELANPEVHEAQFVSANPDLNRIFEAARETCRQNAVDIFMDCPSRERAGWLSDSFFTARVAFDLSGHAQIERNFLENFLLPQKFPFLPDGMLPMCYPADHPSGTFIPNWALWFVLELEEYAARTGDRDMVEAWRPKVLRLLEYFRQFQNEDGLLEKLPSWVFVEWSEANRFVQDVNYPSNMLYAGALDAAARLFGAPALHAQAEKVLDSVRKRSFDGQFFTDNAVRKDGKLEPTRNRTEVCQYFAFYFGAASRETHGALWNRLERDFGPKRKAHPEIHPANAFIGNYLRLELLSRFGVNTQILQELEGYFLKMADLTGTLWENDSTDASCNHGFASHVAHVLYRDILGIRSFDPVAKRVLLRFSQLPLAWCSGRIPVDEGALEIRWRQSAGRLKYQVRIPAGYSVQVEHSPGLEALPETTAESDR